MSKFTITVVLAAVILLVGAAIVVAQEQTTPPGTTGTGMMGPGTGGPGYGHMGNVDPATMQKMHELMSTGNWQEMYNTCQQVYQQGTTPAPPAQ